MNVFYSNSGDIVIYVYSIKTWPIYYVANNQWELQHPNVFHHVLSL